MLVLTKTYGNNSNILFQNLHFDAFCRSVGVKFVNPFMRKYGSVFPNLQLEADFGDFSKIQLFVAFLWSHRITESTSNGSFRILKQRIARSGENKLFVSGWGFKSFEDTEMMREYYKRLFTPIRAKEILEQKFHHQHPNKTLAVHIRRGDYRTWNAGIYCYSDEVYIQAINRVLEQDRDIHRVCIFSNEHVDQESFSLISMPVSIETNEWFHDQWIMAHCDYIIGPPSTFSLWASYIGSVPVWHINGQSGPSFTVCRG